MNGGFGFAGLAIGRRGPLLVREEPVASRDAPSTHATLRGAAWTLLYASDLHLSGRGDPRSDPLSAALVAAARAARPDVVLLGGDLVDRRSGLDCLSACVRQLTDVAPVAAVAGNHDAAAGLAAVRAAVRDGGGRWLHDAPLTLRHAGRRPLHCTTDRRADADARSEEPGLHVFVGHHPAAAAAAARHGFDLALAGHLHGGQCVLWQRGTRLYPGAWFSRWNGLRFEVGATTLLVSRGAADTLPIRFRCPREVVRCELT